MTAAKKATKSSIRRSAGSRRRARRAQKAPELDGERLAPFADQQRGDEEPRQDEEGVHPHEPAVHVRDAAVEHHHGERRRRPARRRARGDRRDECARPRSRRPAWGPSLLGRLRAAPHSGWPGTRHSRRTGPRPRRRLRSLPCALLSPTRPLALRPPPHAGARRAPSPSQDICPGPGRARRRRRRRAPTSAAGHRLSPLRARIVAVAQGQVGYRTDPSDTYCNKFSAYWDAGVDDCGNDNLDEQWCADFAAWAWKQAGAEVVVPAAPGLPQRQLRQLLRLGHRPRHLAPRRIGLHAAAGRRRGLRARHLGASPPSTSPSSSRPRATTPRPTSSTATVTAPATASSSSGTTRPSPT